MEVRDSLSGIGVILAAMAAFATVETIIPLRRSAPTSGRRACSNIILTFLTFALNLLLNIPILLGLDHLSAAGLGLFNAIDAPAALEIAGAVLVLDFAWYVTHRTMHHAPILWRLHLVHHSDPMVDVTTTIRQHPGEGIVRYLFLAVFAFGVGASPLAFAVYRVWSALHGLFEHANLKLPGRIETAISILFTSPNMHKSHHSRNERFTNRNYANIFSIWDRLLGTFTPPRFGTDVDYGLDGEDAPARQSVVGLLAAPFVRP